MYPEADTPVTVKVNVPEAADCGDARLTTPEEFVVPDTDPETTPLQEPVTKTPEMALPARFFIVTAALAETAVVELLEVSVSALT